MITARAFAGKHYAVYGLARSGRAALNSLVVSGAEVTVWDRDLDAREDAIDDVIGLSHDLRLDHAAVHVTNLDEIELTQFDSLVVTPGLPLNRHPIASRAREARVEIIGDIELFARARGELPPHKVVGITGTNGKSTTTALVHHILKTAGVPTTMGGNIGLPILAQDPLPEGGVYVLELSSYQIDLTQSLDCDVAVLLNITPDHLDRYESFEAYAASKRRLFEMQTSKHVSIARVDEWFGNSNAGSVCVLGEAFHDWQGDPKGSLSVYEQSEWPALQGPHNYENVCAAIHVCYILGLNGQQIRNGLRTYPGLPHRMERVREKGGVLFVNDSKATNPSATAPALAAFERIRWICGGLAKTDNLDECAPHFDHVRKAYTIGEAGELFASLLSQHMDVAECVTLDRAVGEAAAEAEAGDTVLLSPACASFDQFRDFEERGDQFRRLVEEL